MAVKLSSSANREYGQLTVAEKARLLFWINVLPLHVVYSLATTRSPKPWRRIASESIARFSMRRFPTFAPQYLLRSSLDVYERWTAARKLPRTIDALPNDVKLLWIGPKRLDNVILFIHGGGFVYPMSDFAHCFLRHVQFEIQQRLGKPIGMVSLSYNLIPTGRFPSQLRDAQSAVDFLLRSGVKPSNLQLLGESAGGTIILQLLRHIHHPHPAVAPLPRGTRVAGACVISPGVPYHDGDGESKEDIINLKALRRFSALLVHDVLESDLCYLRPGEGFLGDLEVRLMVTAGDKEVMKGGHRRLYEELVRCPGVALKWVVDEGGFHCGPVFDFPMLILEGRPYVGDATREVVRWLGDGFAVLVEP